MGRKRQGRVLDVYVGSSKVGQYSRAPGGATSFRYDPDWLASERAFPISLSMPLSDRIWSGEGPTSYFDGLLPDDRTVREKIATREHAESAGIFDLLAVIGRDCVGALRFVPEGLDTGDPTRMEYRPVTDEEIAARLGALGTNPLGLYAEEDDFRISIAGVQEKTAFLQVDNQWQLPLGPTPTSHIFKPAMKEGPNGADFSDTPWNEWLCLVLCRALGLETANAEVQRYDGKPVIVVERFDRTRKEGVLYRLPQEDICQALGVPPLRKYQSDGGPGIVDVMDFLNGAVAPHEDRLTFMKAQIVFWLMAAIDGIQNKIDPGDPLDKDIYNLPPEELAEIPSAPGSLDEAIDALKADQEFLLKGDVFTQDAIDMWIEYKTENEINDVKLRPHPHEFFLYYDI